MKKKLFITFFPQICALIIIFVSLMVMVGWVQSNTYLVQIVPTFAPMQFNTALSFFLIGIGIWTSTLNFRKISFVLGTLAPIIPLLTLIQYFFNFDFGIDELFMSHDITVRTSHPGRMSPNTALLFVFSGLGIFFRAISDQFSRNYITAIFASIVFLFSLDQLIEYAFQLETYKTWNAYSQMALHTTVLFLFSALALFLNSLTYTKEGAVSKWFYVAVGIGLFGLVIRSWDLLFISKVYSGKVFFSTFVIVFVLLVTLTVYVLYRLFTMLNRLETSEMYQGSSEGYKSQLLHHISHELKNPVATLNEFVEIIKTEKDPAKVDEMYATLKSLSHHILGVADDLLGFARIESGHMQVNAELFETKGWIEKIQSIYQEQVKTKNRSFSFHVAENFPAKLNGDEGKLSQVIFNFLDNAIKYSNQQGSIELMLDYIHDSSTLHIAVFNTGPGIAEDDIPVLFSPFTQFDQASEKTGHGLGLSICKFYIDEMGGKISVESKKDEKTAFHVHVPLKKGE